MAENSKIEWTTHTFNPWRGCTKISPGCANCYAETLSHRNPSVLGVWGDKGTRVVASEAMWREPLKWNRKAEEAGERHRVFCASLADVFEDRPELMAPRYRLFDLIQRTPRLDWLLLTKRPENVKPLWPWSLWNVPNIWLGVSVEDQARADERIRLLIQLPIVVRFLSVEPLLGPVDLEEVPVGMCGPLRPGAATDAGSRIDWVIVGGESGPGARPMHPEWPRSIRDQCQAAGVPFFFKQWGEWGPKPNGDWNTKDRHWFHDGPGEDDGTEVFRVGKRVTGRLLDGREWNEFPEGSA